MRDRVIRGIALGYISPCQGRKDFQKFTRRKKRAFLVERDHFMRSSFRGGDASLAWDILEEKRAPTPITDPSSWFAYAKSLYDVPDQPAPDMLHMVRPDFSTFFTSSGVKEALKRLHNRRARDHEGLQTEFFSHGQEVLSPILAHLFNNALCHGFPHSWTMHTIFPIHKAGDPMMPTNYRTIMVGHTLAKIYASVLERRMSTWAEQHGHRALGQAGFRRQHSTLDHIFTLRTIIEEARSRSEKVYCCFVDFRKAFDTVPRARLIQRLRSLDFPDDMIWAAVALYESIRGRVRAPGGLSEEVFSTVGVKQGCPLSPTLFGLYIDEITHFIDRWGGEGCRLAEVMVRILLYADDIVLLSSSPEGLQRHLDALADFCAESGLTVNLGKTKVMVFNTSRSCMRRFSFTYRGEPIEIVPSYVYLGLVFSGPFFDMVPAARARLTRGQMALARLERQCFQAHFQDPPTKVWLFDTLVRPAVMYGAPFWGGDLPSTVWTQIERLQVMMCSRMIRSKASVPHQIIQAEFAASPLQIDALFQTVTYIQRVWSMPTYRLPRQALMSSQRLAARGAPRCWYACVSRWFETHGFSMDRMPPFQYSLDAPSLELTHQEINRIIRLDIQRLWMHRAWWPEQGLSTKLQFYRDHFMHWSQDGQIVRPRYMEVFMSHARRIALGQIRVSSHRLEIEAGRAAGVPRERRICRLCTMGEVESEEHFICGCPLYYEIRGRYHCLFEEGFGPLRRIMDFSDQRCLGVFLIELHRHRDMSLRQIRLASREGQDSTSIDVGQRLITDFMEGQEVSHATQRDSSQRQTGRGRRRQTTRRREPRPLAVRAITSFMRQPPPQGVTIDMARRIHRASRPPPPTRRVTSRQLQIRDILDRHRQRQRQPPRPFAEVFPALAELLRSIPG